MVKLTEKPRIYQDGFQNEELRYINNYKNVNKNFKDSIRKQKFGA